MEIGVGLPTTVHDVKGSAILAWACRADAGPFFSLGIIDRLVYGNAEPLIALAVAAGATQRVRVLASVLLAPLRSAALMAKEAASLDALSGGRLTLGLGVGSREVDFLAAGRSFSERGRRFDDQLATLKRVWAGEAMSAEVGAIGPTPAQPGGPPVLIGGFGPAAMRRVGPWGDGFIGTVVEPATAALLYGLAEVAWREAGRAGRPRFAMGLYYALGPGAAESGAAYARDYDAFDPGMAEAIASSVLTTPESIAGAIRTYGEVGVDEINFWPTSADLDQLVRLEGAVR